MNVQLTRFSFLRFLSFLFLALLLRTPLAQANGVDPNTQWKQIETPHFLIIYDSKHQQLAKKYSEFAEQAFLTVQPSFGPFPERTVLLLNDSSDIANGFASGFPYPTITSFPVLPSPLDSIGDYGNWGLELMTHEYTHILAFEPATGFMRPLRWIFGSIARPNILLPRWYHEGLAVELETRFSKFGRLRSPNYLSIPRSLVLEDALYAQDIGRINEFLPDWPGGIRPYLMGGLLWNELLSRTESSFIGELNLNYSRRVPFFINGPIENKLGIDFDALLDLTYENIEKRALKQIEDIKAQGEFHSHPIKQDGFFNHSPSVSPNGLSLAFIGRTHNTESAVYLATKESLKSSFNDTEVPPKSLTTGLSISRVTWLNDSSGFIFDSVDTFDHYYEYSDLYLFNLSTEKKTQLTSGFRARDPVLDPSNSGLVYVRNDAGQTALYFFSFESKSNVEVYKAPLQHRISRPEFISESKLVFSERNTKGEETLNEIDLSWLPKSHWHATATSLADLFSQPTQDEGPFPTQAISSKRTPQKKLVSYQPIHFPKYTDQGLIFVSDRTGVANLYLANKDLTQARPISNTPTRIMTGEIDPNTDDLIFSELHADGPKISIAKKSDWETHKSLKPIEALVSNNWPPFDPEKMRTDHPEITSPQESEQKYNPWPFLLPRYWLPFVYTTGNGLSLQATTSSRDPIGRHSYQLGLAYDTYSQATDISGLYTNRSTRIPITVTAEKYTELIYNNSIQRDTLTAQLFATFFLPGLSDDWQGLVGVKHAETQVFNQLTSRNGFNAGFRWSQISQKGEEISPEKGGEVQWVMTRFLPDLSAIGYTQNEINAGTYLSGWILPQRHVLALNTHALLTDLTDTNLAASTVGYPTQGTPKTNNFVMRGYRSGVFLGRKLITGSAEYRFPISYVYKGFSTKPFFLHRFHAAAFVDALTLDGFSFNFNKVAYQNESLGRFFVGAGLELKADTTIFYQIPMQIVYGIYYGLERNANPDGLTYYIGFGL